MKDKVKKNKTAAALQRTCDKETTSMNHKPVEDRELPDTP